MAQRASKLAPCVFQMFSFISFFILHFLCVFFFLNFYIQFRRSFHITLFTFPFTHETKENAGEKKNEEKRMLFTFYILHLIFSLFECCMLMHKASFFSPFSSALCFGVYVFVNFAWNIFYFFLVQIVQRIRNMEYGSSSTVPLQPTKWKKNKLCAIFVLCDWNWKTMS